MAAEVGIVDCTVADLDTVVAVASWVDQVVAGTTS